MAFPYLWNYLDTVCRLQEGGHPKRWLTDGDEAHPPNCRNWSSRGISLKASLGRCSLMLGPAGSNPRAAARLAWRPNGPGLQGSARRAPLGPYPISGKDWPYRDGLRQQYPKPV